MAAQSRFRLEPYSYAEARTLQRELDLAEPVAVALVRRGYRTPEAARAFLAADESHDPREFESMDRVAEQIHAAARAGARITVHGDYDVDGVSATATMVGALRLIGADCDWFVPDRLRQGYGLTRESVELLAGRGTDLIVTVDCGIGSPEAVARAGELGVSVIVTDHHEPGETLPSCPILHPRLGGYPYGELCGTGVAWKLATVLAGVDYAGETLDLVALATVADMVPLTGENRSLVRRGLAVARRALRPGLRALCAAASVDPGRLDESHFGFRLGPRINAAGRLYRADSAVELLLTEDPERAAAIAAELNLANSERRETERAVLDGAGQAYRELDPDGSRAALVLAGRGWHPGVVGIAASRMVERHGVPVVLIGVDEDGRGRGSARSVPGFDLLAGLDACARHLSRYGGHRAAAGLEIDADSIDAFREAFTAHVAAERGEEPEPQAETIDAIVGAENLGLGVAQQFERLAPFGVGNPQVRLLVPGARLGDVRPMGKDERHARFTLASGSRRALGVAFGVNGELGEAAEAEEPLDVSLRLEVNEWNGAVEPRVVLGSLYRSAGGAASGEEGTGLGDEEWWARVEAELAEPTEREAPTAHAAALREVVDRRGASGVAAVASLISAGGPLLILACDAQRRRALVELAAPPARFGGGVVAILSERLSRAAVRSRLDELLAAGSWRRARRLGHAGLQPGDGAELRACPGDRPAELAGPRSPGAACASRAGSWLPAPRVGRRGAEPCDAGPRGGTGRRGRCWRRSTARFRAGAAGEPLDRPAVRAALEGPGPFPRSPEAAARCLRVFEELGLVRRAARTPRFRPRGRILGGNRARALGCVRRLQAALRGRHEIPERATTSELTESQSADSAPPRDRAGHTRVGLTSRSTRRSPARGRPRSWERRSGPSSATSWRSSPSTPRTATTRSIAARSRSRSRSRAPATPTRRGARARTSSPTRSRSRRSARGCGSTPRRCAPRCSTTRSRTRPRASQEVEGTLRRAGRATLVDGVTKLTGITFQSRDEKQAENYRKMMVAMATDVRVILIKLADRLHNMRTLEALPKQKQLEKARETLEIYAPLAHRLGIHAIKWELEDLSFQRLHPRKYEEIKTLVSQQRAERERYVEDAGRFLTAELGDVGIEAEISGRAKHFYSIYSKMSKKGREFNEIYDLTAMRVIVGSVKDCYGAIGIIHSLWKPLPGRFKDFIATPKLNLYQALHTTVIGPEGRPLEIQVRTSEMHELAEYGIAAHVIYKEGSRRGKADPEREKMTWLRQLVDSEDDQDPKGLPRAAQGRPLRGRGLRVHPARRGQEPRRRARRRSTSPTRSTPTSGTAASERR